LQEIQGISQFSPELTLILRAHYLLILHHIPQISQSPQSAPITQYYWLTPTQMKCLLKISNNDRQWQMSLKFYSLTRPIYTLQTHTGWPLNVSCHLKKVVVSLHSADSKTYVTRWSATLGTNVLWLPAH